MIGRPTVFFESFLRISSVTRNRSVNLTGEIKSTQCSHRAPGRTTIFNSSPRGSYAVFRPLRALPASGTYMLTQADT